VDIFSNKKHEIVWENEWAKVKKSEKGFFYFERKGKNSIALLLYKSTGEVCPITGSVDPEDSSYEEAAVREAFEEAGYDIKDSIKFMGSNLVSTQTNEICYNFIACVDGQEPVEAKGDGGYFESISRNEWMNAFDVYGLDNVYSSLLILVEDVFDVLYSKDPNNIEG